MAIYRALSILYEKWVIPFIGRKVNKTYYEKFDHNGYYPSDYDTTYAERAIILNLKPSISISGTIKNIDYYKVCEAYGGHGRPVTDDKALDGRDIELFTSILDECTEGRAEAIIKEYGLEEQTVIPKNVLNTIIEISFTYPEVLYNPDFWESNTKVVSKKYAKKAINMLSAINWRAYDNGEELIISVEKRLHDIKMENADNAISESIFTQNDEQFYSNISYLTVPEAHIKDLQYAIESGRYDYVYELAKEGTDFSLNENVRFFNDNQLIELVPCWNIEWGSAALDRLYAIDKTLLNEVFNHCQSFEGAQHVDYYQEIIEWAFSLKDIDIIKALADSQCKIYLYSSVRNFKIRESLVRFVESMVDTPDEIRKYVEPVFCSSGRYFDACVESILKSYAKKKDVAGMERVANAYGREFGLPLPKESI